MASITISASFGARGSFIGPAVAERLGLAFFDRAIPLAVARKFQLSDASVESFDERAPSRWERLAAAFAELSPSFGSPTAPIGLIEAPGDFRSATEAVVREIADTTGAVILGRAGMVVLANRPDVLCVRLDGPLDARIAQAVADGSDASKARQAAKDADGAREGYASFFYNVRQDDSHLYHLLVDSTALDLPTCVDLIATAAKARFSSAKSEPQRQGSPQSNL